MPEVCWIPGYRYFDEQKKGYPGYTYWNIPFLLLHIFLKHSQGLFIHRIERPVYGVNDNMSKVAHRIDGNDHLIIAEFRVMYEEGHVSMESEFYGSSFPMFDGALNHCLFIS